MTPVVRILKKPIALQLLAVLIGAGIWEFVGQLRISFLFPPLSGVIQALVELVTGDDLIGALAYSLTSFLIGYGICLVVGIVLGVAMGVSRSVRLVFGTYLELLMSIPPIAFVPLILIWLGPSRPAQVIVIVTFSLPALVVNIEKGIRTVEPGFIEMARSFGYSGLHLIRSVVFPGGLPLILAGIRISTARAVKGMVTAEVLIAATGLGGMLDVYGDRLDGAKVYAIIVALLIVAVALSEAVRRSEKRLLRWQDT